MGYHGWFPNQFPPFILVFHCPLGLGELQAYPFPNVVFLPLPLSTLSSSPFHCALQDGIGQIWWSGDMTIPMQSASLYDRQEVFVWSSCLLDLGTDFLVGNMVFVWDVKYLPVAPHFHGLYFSLELCCEGPWFTRVKLKPNKEGEELDMGRKAQTTTVIVLGLTLRNLSLGLWACRQQYSIRSFSFSSQNCFLLLLFVCVWFFFFFFFVSLSFSFRPTYPLTTLWKLY